MEKHVCDSSCHHKDKRPFLQLHTHSRIGSPRDCTASVDQMFKICKDNNLSFALTDHGYGAAFAEVYKQSKKYDVKPVYGVEFYLSRKRDRLFEIREKLENLKGLKNLSKEEKANVDEEIRLLNFEFEEIKKYNHICIIAKNLHGFKNIIALHNTATLQGFYGKPLASLANIFDMEKDKSGDRGVVVTSACLSGVIPREYLNGRDSIAYEHAGIMKEEFRDDWYLEVQPHELKEQRLVNKKLIELSTKLHIPLVIGTDSHYVSKDYSQSHEIFLLLQGEQKVSDIGKKVQRVTYSTARGETRRKKLEGEELFHGVPISEIKEGQYFSKKSGIISSDDKWDFVIKNIEEVNKVWMIESADLSFKTETELISHIDKFEELLPIKNEIIKNNKDILEKVEQFEWDNDLKLPIEEGADVRLFDLCLAALKEKKLYSNKEYLERFKTEFKVIKNGGLSSYFLILLDMIDYAKSIELPVGPGRGSSGSSLIAFLLGITRIDPISWNFNFERFLNSRKVDMEGERIRVTVGDREIDFKPKEMVKLKNGTEKKAKDLTEDDDLDI